MIRKRILSVADKFLLPGRLAFETLSSWGVSPKKVIYFPNVINEQVWNTFLPQRGLIKRRNEIRIMLVARLIEKRKGIRNFIESILILDGSILLDVYGSGPDLKQYLEILPSWSKGNLTVNFLGERAEEELAILINNYHAFVLPSLSDASPLAIIEAASMGIPILVSNRCGNASDVVINDYNGYIFNPTEINSILTTMNSFLDMDDERWRIFKNRSRELYVTRFSADMVIDNLLKSL